jgi:dihydroorotate dehydrogenase (fumarate)
MAAKSMIDLRINFLGKQLQSPLILASGPLSHNGGAIVRAHQAGFGAVVTKTISSTAAKNSFPHLIKNNRSLFNCEKWSEISSRQWIEKEIPYAKKNGAVVIASIGLSLPDVRNLAVKIADAGADFIELVSYQADNITPMVEEAVSLLKIPVIAKVSYNWHDCAAIARQCLKAGAAAISAIDSIGPGLRIDIRTGKPLLGSADGRGWISGEAIRPLALHCIAEIAGLAPDVVIVGTGGVSNAEDALEMFMAGASAVGICSLPLKKGLGCVKKLLTDLNKLLNQLGYNSLDEVKNLCQPYLKKNESFSEGSVIINNEMCNDCKLCIKLCPYQAIASRNNKLYINESDCHLCGYCISVCPKEAISLVE